MKKEKGSQGDPTIGYLVILFIYLFFNITTFFWANFLDNSLLNLLNGSYPYAELYVFA